MPREESTKKTIASVFEELLESKSFNQITVKEIMSKCNMSRQVFYYHFVDIYDLMQWIHQQQIEESVHAFEENKDFEESVYVTLKVLKSNKKFYSAIIKTEGYNSFVESFTKYIIQKSKKDIGKKRLNEEINLAYDIFWPGAVIEMIKWMQNDRGIKPEVMARYIYNCLPQVVKKFYE